MRILYVADLHYALKQFDWLVAQARNHEVVAIGGDLLDLASDLSCDVQIVVVEEYLLKLSASARVLVCSGSHDGDRWNEAGEAEAAWLKRLRNARLAVDFDHVNLDGTLVTICPWQGGPAGWVNTGTLLEDGASMTKDRWIWLHHAPPDRTRVSWNGRRFLGEKKLIKLIQTYRPDLVLSGHIHRAPFVADGSWIDRLGGTWLMNPGRQTGPEPSFITLDLESMSARWTSAVETSERALASTDPR